LHMLYLLINNQNTKTFQTESLLMKITKTLVITVICLTSLTMNGAQKKEDALTITSLKEQFNKALMARVNKDRTLKQELTYFYDKLLLNPNIPTKVTLSEYYRLAFLCSFFVQTMVKNELMEHEKSVDWTTNASHALKDVPHCKSFDSINLLIPTIARMFHKTTIKEATIVPEDILLNAKK